LLISVCADQVKTAGFPWHDKIKGDNPIFAGTATSKEPSKLTIIRLYSRRHHSRESLCATLSVSCDQDRSDGACGFGPLADRAKPLRDYCAGLMLPCEHKSVEPIAAVTAPSRVSAQHQTLLHFIGEGPWSDEKNAGEGA
jgi:hypothetical protein